MEKLLDYLNALPKDERKPFCDRLGTSEGYLRKACSLKQRLSVELCVAIERETNRAVRCEGLRRDVDWKYLRAPA